LQRARSLVLGPRYSRLAVVSDEGYRRMPDDELGALVEGVLDARRVVPDGPRSPLR